MNHGLTKQLGIISIRLHARPLRIHVTVLENNSVGGGKNQHQGADRAVDLVPDCHILLTWTAANLMGGDGRRIKSSTESIVISTTQDFFVRLTQNKSLWLSLADPSENVTVLSRLTCSNCAEYEPVVSLSGRYCSTIPFDARQFIFASRQHTCILLSWDQDTHGGQILLHAKTVEVTTAKYQRAEILADRLV